MKPEDVVELRVHGVSGTPPEHVLGDPFPTPVAGDDVARFLRAARPAATLPGERPARERVVEAFHWGRFTSGGASRALWLLMAPFAVLNLARYALLGPGRFAEAVLRLLGLVLTCMFVTTVGYVSLELLVRQCAADAACRAEHTWLGSFADWPFGALLLLGTAPPVLVVAVLWWFGRQTFLYEPRGTHHRWETHSGSLGDYAFWHTSPRTPVLRDAHVAASCVVLGVLHAGALRTALPDGALSWSVIGPGLALLSWAVGCVVAAPDRRAVNTRPLKWAGAVYLLLTTGLSAAFLWRLRTDPAPPLAGFEAVTNVLAALAMLLLVALFAACARMRRSRRGAELMAVDARFRPMWHGYGTVVIAALATTLAVGFSGGLAYRVVESLGVAAPAGPPGSDGPGLELSTGYLFGAGLWGVLAIGFALLLGPVVAAMVRQASSAVLLAAGSALACAAVVLRWAPVPDWAFWAFLAGAGALCAMGAWSGVRHAVGEAVRAGVCEDYPGPPTRPGIAKVVLSRRLASAKYRYHWVLGSLAVLGGVLVVASGAIALARLVVPGWRATPPPRLADWLSSRPAQELGGLGSLVVSGFVVVLLVLGLRSWQSGSMRTAVGVVWDLVAFWPRAAHPICPPPYGGRATIELTSRAVRLAGHHGTEAVVLSGHSQGSVVCFAALALLRREAERPDPADGRRYIGQAEAAEALRRVGLVTYGSQLQWAYSRLFPHYLGHAELCSLHAELEGRWWNVHRLTDPLGGPVEAWEATEDERVCAGDKLWGVRCGYDVRLRDPEFLDPDPDRVASPLRGHGDYYRDPVFDEVVARVAEAVVERREAEVLRALSP